MPHIHDIFQALWAPPAGERRTAADHAAFHSALFTAKEAAVGFALGAVLGFALARAAVALSDPVAGLSALGRRVADLPILAVAPMVVVWLNPKLPTRSQDWGAVAVIAAYLTFFPVTINTIRGLHSADRRALELMRSYAAGEWRILWKLRFPAALPYIFAALKISATASVVGAIIGELPSSIQDGLGGAIINFNQYYTPQPTESLGDQRHRGRTRHLVLPRLVRSSRSSSSAGRRRISRERVSVVRSESVTKRSARRRAALQGIDLDIEPGEFVSLIGPSGCGKSTLLRIIGDLIEPTSGTITVNGKPARRARLDRDYGIVFQDAVLYDWRTVARTSPCRSSWRAGTGAAASRRSRRCSSSSS